jgi:uncharacterized protein YfaS (alpha-2-macroglobulin family)
LPGGFDLVVPNAPVAAQPLLSATAGNTDAETQDDAGAVRGCVCRWLVSRPPNFPDYADLREDRVVLYGQATDQVQEFSYRIKSTTAGSFVVPASYGESMYDPSVQARSSAGHLTVDSP